MAASILFDKTYLMVIILSLITGVFGIIKLSQFKSRRIDNRMTDEQSDQLVMGVFHLVVSAVCICCLF
jgi:uncharacterized membrane protein YidH (DUF202 family)